MRTVEAVIGKWPEVFEKFGMPPVTGKKHYAGACPICGRKGKFRIDDRGGTGSWICTCESGNGWKLLELATNMDFKTLARKVDEILGNTYKPETQPNKIKPTQSVAEYFLTLQRIEESPAFEYFHSRNIYQLPQRGVRYSAGEIYEKGVVIPALVAIASNEYGEPVYKHCTFIQNGKKADVDAPRKMYTVMENYEGSVAVKLKDATNVLGIGEGIETALSAGFIYRMPCWAVLNATLMKKFRAPPGVEGLYIYADNDSNGTGLAAAFECGNRNLLAKNDVRRVFIRWPKRVNDFNDLMSEGDEVLQWDLSI